MQTEEEDYYIIIYYSLLHEEMEIYAASVTPTEQRAAQVSLLKFNLHGRLALVLLNPTKWAFREISKMLLITSFQKFLLYKQHFFMQALLHQKENQMPKCYSDCTQQAYCYPTEMSASV